MMTLQERVHGVKPPKDWSLNKLHHVLTVRKNNKNIGMLNDNLLSLSYGKIINKDIDTTEGLLPESFETYQIVTPGDIVMRLTDLQNDKRSIRQGLVKERGIITSAYDAVYPAKCHDSRYWAYALLALDLAKYYYSLGGGVRQSIKFKDFPNDWIHVAPQATQKEIADFLDREISRIDQLIERKLKLISIIKSRHDSYINKVFDGFNLRKIKTLASYQLSNVDKHIFEEEIAVNVVHYTDVYYNDLITSGTELPVGSVTELEKKKFTLMGGEVLITKDSETPDDIAVPVYIESVKPDTVCGYHVSILRPSKLLDGRFLFWALKTKKVRDYFMLAAQGVTRYGLPLGKIGDCPTPYIDDLTTQKELADDLFEKNARNLSLIEKVNGSIAGLKEIKTAIITQAVTGQLDIQAWQKRGMGDKRLDQIEQDMEQKKGKKASA
jgi:type I restriction enzyme S subunit